MRYIRYAFWGVLAIILISISLANRGPMTLSLLPDPVAEVANWNVQFTVPVFVAILASIAFGLLIGFVWEWLREFKHRREVTAKSREVRTLEREVSKLKTEKNKDKDEVLALLEDA